MEEKKIDIGSQIDLTEELMFCNENSRWQFNVMLLSQIEIVAHREFNSVINDNSSQLEHYNDCIRCGEELSILNINNELCNTCETLMHVDDYDSILDYNISILKRQRK